MSISKRIFLSSSIALLVVLMFWGIYSLSFKKPSEQSTPSATKNQTDTANIEPIKDLPQISAITDEAVLAPTFSADEKKIEYYSKTTGKAYRIDIDGTNKQIISNTDLVGLSAILWSSDKSKVISRYDQNNRPSFFMYDYEQLKGSGLSSNTLNAAWYQSNKIFYEYFDQKSKLATLNIANPDGSNWNKIIDLPFQNVSIAPIPKTGLVSFWNKQDSFTETLMQATPVVGGEKRDLLKEKFGADYLWSLDGNNLLVSHVVEKGSSKLQLALLNSLGGEYKNLGIPTMVSKCAWSKNNKLIYYALPGSIPDGTVLPNDYISGKLNTTDTFWKLDTATKESSRLIELDKIKDKYDATNLFLNSDESILFFTNRVDGKLYRIDI